jgi:CheY-like chemotaxis protein/two-component sensor histidine kinase
MVRLVDDLLDISRVSSGAIELQRQSCDLAEVMETVLENHRTLLDRRQQVLTKEVAAPVFVDGDPTRLAQIVGNLLHNAIKFTPEGGRISIQVRREHDRAEVTVTDSGEGIVPDDLERMFEMFARVNHPGSNPERGLGIGLALARQLASLHGGSLTATSPGLGRGASFTLSLPTIEAPPFSVGGPAQLEPKGPTEALKVAVIEDGEDIAETLTTLLEHLGHQVEVARSGEAGVSLVAATKPDLVLCDLGLPGIDGVEVCRLIRRMDLERPPLVVALTGWGREDDVRRTREAGFDDHLVKPVKAERLKTIFRDVAARRFQQKRAG